MAYVGRGVDKISNIEVLDAITFTNSAGPYNLTKDSAAFVPTASNALVISIDGIIQSPASYTTSVATITFDTSMASTSTMNFIYQLGTGILTSPSDDSVTTAKIANDAVTYAKMQDIATGNRVLGRATAGEISEVQVSNDMLAGSIANAKLANDTITINSQAIALGGSGTIDVTDTKPTITSLTPSVIENTSTAVVIAGTNFVSVPIVEAINTSGAISAADSVSFTSSTSITATFTLPVDGTYYVRVENNSGDAVRTGTADLTVSDAPTWVTASGSLGTFSGSVAISTITLTATDATSFAVTSGAVTAGLTFSTGVGSATITGTQTAHTTAATDLFTVTATDAEGQTAARAFTITWSFGATGGAQFNQDFIMANGTASIDRTFGTPTDNIKWTWSGWVKPSMAQEQGLFFGYVDASNYAQIGLSSTNQLQFYNHAGGGASGNKKTNRVLRDCAAFYHIVVVFDSANGTPGDRIKIYVNGVRETSFATDADPTASAASKINGAWLHEVGAKLGSYNFSGVMSHVNFCDGQAYTPSDFGETDSTSGIWKPNTSPSVTYGNNGFFLKMEDRTNLDLDSGTNAFTFTTSGDLTATYDNPSNNFVTLNPLGENVLMTGTHDLLNGNTTYDPTNTGNESWSASTLGAAAGKWYWEVKLAGTMAGDWPDIGFINMDDISTRQSASSPPQHNTTYLGVYEPNGTKWIFGTQTTSWGSGYTAGDIIQCAVDCDNGKLWWGKNGTWETSGATGDPANGTNESGTFTAGTLMGPYVAGYEAGSVYLYHNFGNGYFGTTAVSTAEADGAGIGAFEYAPPTGFYALCTKNIKAYGG